MNDSTDKWGKREIIVLNRVEKSYMNPVGDWVMVLDDHSEVTINNSHDGILPYVGSEVIMYAHEENGMVHLHGCELNSEMLYYYSPADFAKKVP